MMRNAKNLDSQCCCFILDQRYDPIRVLFIEGRVDLLRHVQ